MQVKKQKFNKTWNKTGSTLGTGFGKAIYIVSCLFNFYAEYIMWNAGLDEAQARIKILKYQ